MAGEVVLKVSLYVDDCRDTLKAAETARELLWGDDDNVPLEHWVAISQRSVATL